MFQKSERSPIWMVMEPKFANPHNAYVAMVNERGLNWSRSFTRSIPHLEALHKKYKDQGLVTIGMNHERDHDKVKEFAKEHISYIVLLDADREFAEYGSQTLHQVSLYVQLSRGN